MRRYWIIGTIVIGVIVAALCLGALPAQAQDFEYTGYIGDGILADSYRITAQAGDAISVRVEANSGNLDTILELWNPGGELIAYNDNAASYTLNSSLVHAATVDGTYTVVVGRYEFTTTGGAYTLYIMVGDEVMAAPNYSAYHDSRYVLSGTGQFHDTEHFRIHYTLEGYDATTAAFAERIGQTFEMVRDFEIGHLGWPVPPSDGTLGGDDRYDVYLGDLLNEYGSGALGYTAPEMEMTGDNPNTEAVEVRATPSYIVLDNDFAESSDPSLGMVFTVAAHEYHHAIQMGYDYAELHDWYYEATSVWVQTLANKVNPDVVDVSEYNFEYPALCFGTATLDPYYGQMQYGDWLFIQSLADEYGNQIVRELWEAIVSGEGFEGLETTLAAYGDTIPDALARYRIQNLIRGYEVAEDFTATVLLANTIRYAGRWTVADGGVQELGAGYFDLRVPLGTYRTSLFGDNGSLELWAVGVVGQEASVIRLGRGGNIDISLYDFNNLMVFNPAHDNSVEQCNYTRYGIEIYAVDGAPTPVERTWDAAYFRPLR